MITTYCECGNCLTTPESAIATPAACPKCGVTFRYVCAEELPDGTGAADFDARLAVISGPDRRGEQLLLGGVSEIQIGKLPDKQVQLGGSKVSRFHCKLNRLDFAPSRWSIEDNRSTNGLFVNGHRVDSQELKDGDVIHVGDYEFKFVSTYERDIAATNAAINKAKLAAGGTLCPSCGKVLGKSAKICTNCGVDLKTGKSLVVSKGLDEDDLAVRADTWTRTLSWIIPLGLFPIASEAFGTKKPLSTWVIFGITCVVSVLFLFPMIGERHPSTAVLNLMQWNGDPHAENHRNAELQKRLEDELKKVESQGTRQSARRVEKLEEAIAELEERAEGPPPGVGFHWYQVFTSATLHQPALIMPFIMHLGGNMLFLLVFGLRVNELIGNTRMAIVYPLLAVTSGLAHHFAEMHGPLMPSLGASGAIMGLAGMYFVFFPVQKVFMIIWFRAGILTGWKCFYKVFRMRGFWLLLMWVGLNDLLPMMLASRDSVAHWAHLGGFLSGMVVALILLLSRQVSARGGDLLSVSLGKRAWSLVGKPSDWHGDGAKAPGLVA